MLPDGHSELKEIKALVRENNKMLSKLRRAQVINRVFHAIYWIVIIGAALGLFYFLQPYFEGVQNIFQGVQNTQESFLGNGIFNLFGGEDAATTTE